MTTDELFSHIEGFLQLNGRKIVRIGTKLRQKRGNPLDSASPAVSAANYGKTCFILSQPLTPVA